MTTSTGRPPAAATSLWRGEHGLVTAGLFSLAFMVAFEALAVVTVMPAVVDDLGGLSLYAVAFGAPVAVSIYSRTAAVPWVERSGPAPALLAGVAAFVAGLLLCASAPSMTVFLAGRAVQGLGMGAIGVTIYVVVALAYPDHLRARAMTVLTSAWMLPAVVGPGIAGWLAHVVGWRAVFWVAPLLAVVSLALTWRVVCRLGGDGSAARSGRRELLAGSVAVAVLLLAVSGQREVPGWPVLLVLSVAVVGALAPRLV
ncbi:MAG: MFS transporter, partial [Actinomycetales bacterium]